MRIIEIKSEAAYSEFACCPAPRISFAEAMIEDDGNIYYICMARETDIEVFYKCGKSIIMLLADHSFIPAGFDEIAEEMIDPAVTQVLRSALDKR